MYFIRTINFQKISALGLLVRFFERAPKGIRYDKARLGPGFGESKNSYEGWDGVHISNLGEIISHNTVVWTGDVNLEYKIVLVLVLWAVIRTKL